MPTVTRIRKDQPVPSDLHVDTFLTNLSVGWAQESGQFIADQVFPTVPVQKQSNKFAKYEKGFFYRDEVGPRPLGGRPPKAGYGIESDTYFCEEEGLEHSIDDRTRANADQPLDPDRAAMRLLTTQALIHRDIEWTSNYFKKEVWGTDLKGKNKEPGAGEFLQFDQSGSTPINLIDENRDTVASQTGYEPKTLVLGRDVYRTLKNHESVLDRIKFTQTGIVTADLLAELFDVDKVLVPGAVKNTAKEGQADEIDFIVSPKSMLLVYAAPNPAIDQPSGGYNFAWTGLLAGVTNAFGGVIERGREELNHSDVLQMRYAFDLKVVASELGVFFENAVA